MHPCSSMCGYSPVFCYSIVFPCYVAQVRHFCSLLLCYSFASLLPCLDWY
jgi:hypothetical protein